MLFYLLKRLLVSFPLLYFQTVEFWREAEILSKLHHPNVVAFYGVVQDGPGGTLATVTEYMVDGSLRHVLLRKDRYYTYFVVNIVLTFASLQLSNYETRFQLLSSFAWIGIFNQGWKKIYLCKH